MTTPEADQTPGADAPGSPRPPKRAMFIVFLVVFIDLLGFGIVLPLLPRYAGDYLPAVPEAARGAVLGLLYSIFSLMQFVFSPVWGRVSDRVGRRPILILGLAGSVVFYALFGLASTLPPEQAWLALGLLFFSRLGAGVAGASVSTAAAVIADCTTRETRARGMALIGAAFGIGFTFGPLIAFGVLSLFPKPDAGGALADIGLDAEDVSAALRGRIVNYAPHAPEVDIAGRIVSVYRGVAQAGRNSVVAINVGKTQGVEVGHVLSISQRGRDVRDRGAEKPVMVKLPDESTGYLLVFRVFDKIAYGLIMDSSQAIALGDDVKNP